MAASLQNRRARIGAPHVAFLSILAFGLSACGGGGGGVDIAEGQGPDPVVLDVPIAYTPLVTFHMRKPLPEGATP